MPDLVTLKAALKNCPPGQSGWKEFEDICTDVLCYLFVPPLTKPQIQTRTFSGIDRRDAVFPNRIVDINNHWGRFYNDLGARFILIEFKNFEKEEIGKEEVNQTRNYLNSKIGRLALICSRCLPNHSAHVARNAIYSEEKKVVLFITTDHLIEMLAIKERGDNPSDLIMDLFESFLLQHE